MGNREGSHCRERLPLQPTFKHDLSRQQTLQKTTYGVENIDKLERMG